MEVTDDSPDVVIAKRLLDYAKQSGFVFQRTASGEDGPLVGYRVSDGWVDLIHIEGFSRDCFAWRKRVSPLIVSQDVLTQRQIEGSNGDFPGDVNLKSGVNFHPQEERHHKHTEGGEPPCWTQRGLCESLLEEVQADSDPERGQEDLERFSVIRKENPPCLQVSDGSLDGRTQRTEFDY